MGLNFGQLVRAAFSKKKTGNFQGRKGQDEAHSREYVRRAARAIKQAVKEPDELPIRENVPAIRELFENGAQPP